ncbi:FMN-binding glutamate synthase family protein [Gelidibacter japonicus]|jgi:glutamate synthase domain-containing protein 2|uniref:FMN-binding glutamate synthase family protein n=1 Tax=Gelidibacter japonicus TaxID=1962232 RepID=UPI00201FE76F|nr:FMN-binding glutamate synthase family protein [Gelidibacter japonicus]MCL8007399.1 FMN-binding glutamate synthase family protein [Gelidibacter japonicus]
MKVREKFILISIIVVVAIVGIALFWSPILWAFVIILPLIILGVFDIFQKSHTIRRNFPLIGRARYMLESIRPEIMQYFVETDTEGRPLNRILRSLIYRRAKGQTDTEPFGTQMDIYHSGYEWLEHSMYAKQNPKEIGEFPRLLIGGKECKQPYSSSLLNISAMSFGSLSKNAVLAMNKGAKMGNFAHNTGEGGISDYHLEHGGDLIWQIGTGYFGCRNDDGSFNDVTFRENATRPQVKMIEIKLSQGAKPGHGGILPAAKNTEEIARIRHVKPGISVHSPPSHTAFSDPIQFMHFIKRLRDLSDGKPIGFKLCLGRKQEFMDFCEAMIYTGITPDFITIDGGEGGTGAAPVEFSNSMGMPLREGLIFVHDTLVGFGLREEIKLIVAGKIITGFHMARAIALGADGCNSARAMMLAVGCIQALQCNLNTCPTGVATQNPSLVKGLVVEDKWPRAKRYHEATIHSFLELVAAAGLNDPSELTRNHISKRVGLYDVKTYDEIYPYMEPNSLLDINTIPESYKKFFHLTRIMK